MRFSDLHQAIKLAGLVALWAGLAVPAAADPLTVQLGSRPFYLVQEMDPGPLKEELQECAAKRVHYHPNLFSIGHRGAPLQFPEHTKESYVAAARMGAGILECDVTFTGDGELVCRHAQCDLHTTTDIVARPDLRAKCAVPPEIGQVTGKLLNGSEIRCCTSNLTLAEFKSLNGKMDASNPNATTVDGYLNATADFRTDLYSTNGALLSHAESIALFNELGTGFAPELKKGDPDDINLVFPNGGQVEYARKIIQEYIAARIDPNRVWAQSFNIADVNQWIAEFPQFGKQAVFLDGRDVQQLAMHPPSLPEFVALKQSGVNIIAPPMPVLLKSGGGAINPSNYAKRAKKAGLDIISWTTERSGRILESGPEGGDFYYQTTLGAIKNDGDILRTIDVLAQGVGIIGLFSDWPATTTFYANCANVRVGQNGNDE